MTDSPACCYLEAAFAHLLRSSSPPPASFWLGRYGLFSICCHSTSTPPPQSVQNTAKEPEKPTTANINKCLISMLSCMSFLENAAFSWWSLPLGVPPAPTHPPCWPVVKMRLNVWREEFQFPLSIDMFMCFPFLALDIWPSRIVSLTSVKILIAVFLLLTEWAISVCHLSPEIVSFGAGGRVLCYSKWGLEVSSLCGVSDFSIAYLACVDQWDCHWFMHWIFSGI